MRAFSRLALLIAGVLAAGAGSAAAAGEYPVTLVADATAKRGTTTVMSKIEIHVDRLMEESRRTRVADALKFNGYMGFLTTLRMLPVIGSISVETRKVDARYAREQQEDTGRRLVVVADRPLFFFGSDTKPRAGYELTIVELRFDAKGGATGTMHGAARVKPAGAGDFILDTFAEDPVQLTVKPR